MDTGQPRSLRLLSLDGGGVGGISALLILKELMWRVKANDKLDNVPLPCHYFDLVGGTSTGGLIALMLGRLRMTIDEAIQSYAKLAQDVFSEVKRGRSERFKAHKLEHFIKEMVRIHTGDANSRMMDSGDSAGRVCRTFVCAMSAHNLNGTIPTIFRTYTAPKNQTVDCMIWEAARATSASPALFKSIQIGLHGVEETFIGGSVGCNNPAATVLSEAELVFGQHAPISCIISIGAGHPKTISLSGGALSFLPGSLPLDVRQAMNAIAQDCEGAAERVAQQFRQRPEVYFRLNVEQGMQNVTLGQWFKLGEAAAHTNQYLKTTDVDRKVDGAVTALRVAHHASSNEPDPFQTLLSPQAISPESSRPSAPTSRARTPLSEERDTTSAPPAQPALHTFSQPYNSSISNSSSAKPSASVPSADVPAGESIFSLINKNFERWKKCDDCIDAFNSVTACAVDYTKAIAALQGKLDEDSTPSGESSQQGYRQRCAMLVRDHASLGERFASRWLDMSDHEIILKVLFPETPLPSGAARSLEVNWDPLRIDLSLKTHVLVRMDGVPIFDSFVNDTSNIVVDLPQFDHRIGMLITVEVSAQASTLGPDTNGSVFQCRGKPATSQYREYPLSSDVVDANADFPYEKHPADLKTVSFGSGDVPVLLLGAYRYWPSFQLY
ncbi:acyl transferase/acyl hydrolase/lysophospholipase [Gloeopeniophorella convolvens]|nr:acyl transferase/acyl hydrolase/lysophospholipase [Gloeopeniophorella convolvens]